jgi:hypothetical protein
MCVHRELRVGIPIAAVPTIMEFIRVDDVAQAEPSGGLESLAGRRAVKSDEKWSHERTMAFSVCGL